MKKITFLFLFLLTPFFAFNQDTISQEPSRLIRPIQKGEKYKIIIPRPSKFKASLYQMKTFSKDQFFYTKGDISGARLFMNIERPGFFVLFIDGCYTNEEKENLTTPGPTNEITKDERFELTGGLGVEGTFPLPLGFGIDGGVMLSIPFEVGVYNGISWTGKKGIWKRFSISAFNWIVPNVPGIFNPGLDLQITFWEKSD